MTDSRLEKLFTELEATFEASVAREEEVAASDLGFALAQSNSLRDVLPRLPYELMLLEEGGGTRVIEIGMDYLVTPSPVRLVPLNRAVIRAGDSGSPPSVTDANLLLTLRRWARRRALIEVACGEEQRRTGYLLNAGADYLELREKCGEVFVALQLLSAIRLLGDPHSFGFS